MKAFDIQPHDGADKSFLIRGPIELEVDYDDVNHAEQDRLARKVVRVLNKHWEEKEPNPKIGPVKKVANWMAPTE